MESLHPDRRRALGRQHLDDHTTIKEGVAREKHARHPTPRQLPFQRVSWSDHVRQALMEHTSIPCGEPDC
jgi:hypothetical protein